MSPNDRISDLQAKLREYQENGVRLGWLLNRGDRQVEIYRPGQPIEILEYSPPQNSLVNRYYRDLY